MPTAPFLVTLRSLRGAAYRMGHHWTFDCQHTIPNPVASICPYQILHKVGLQIVLNPIHRDLLSQSRLLVG